MSGEKKLHIETYRVKSDKEFHIKNYSTEFHNGIDKEEGKRLFEELHSGLSALQDQLFAEKKHSVLLIFQAMDAAGKDGTIKTVMQGVNPQGCRVVSFKKPSEIELSHDFLWRCYKELPSHGEIGIFNRSYYEEVLVTRVHPEFILAQNLPGISKVGDITDDFWEKRFHSIREFEKHLVRSGTVILKFFLHVSKEVQKERFLERIEEPEKNWKFNLNDIREREHWSEYQHAYSETIKNTATDYAPWYVIPSDSNWYRNLLVLQVLQDTLHQIGPRYPVIDSEVKKQLEEGRKDLLSE